MRQKCQKQQPLTPDFAAHPHGRELEVIDCILEKHPMMAELIWKDLCGSTRTSRGAHGMSAEQILRAAVLKQMNGFSYEQLAFHLVDSDSYRAFCGIGIGLKPFRKSTLQKNIKGISATTWEQINKMIIGYAKESGVEKGREVRVDCTVIESNIHDPTDSSLLWDCIRVLNRLMKRAEESFSGVRFHDRTRRAKRRALEIQHAKNAKARRKLYRELVELTEEVVAMARKILNYTNRVSCFDAAGIALQISLNAEICCVTELAERIMDQTRRRVFNGESVPAEEKIVSIFEVHTDIIKKERRDTVYGHKICLTGGKSSMILDCVIEKGNPNDATLTKRMIDRQIELYGCPPLKAAFDGGFTSSTNLDKLKDKGVKDICFSKRRGMSKEDMCRSRWVYDRLRNFRAGIEAGISFLKRSFGLDRATWKGRESFCSYVWASVVSANLLILARLLT